MIPHAQDPLDPIFALKIAYSAELFFAVNGLISNYIVGDRTLKTAAVAALIFAVPPSVTGALAVIATRITQFQKSRTVLTIYMSLLFLTVTALFFTLITLKLFDPHVLVYGYLFGVISAGLLMPIYLMQRSDGYVSIS